MQHCLLSYLQSKGLLSTDCTLLKHLPRYHHQNNSVIVQVNTLYFYFDLHCNDVRWFLSWFNKSISTWLILNNFSLNFRGQQSFDAIICQIPLFVFEGWRSTTVCKFLGKECLLKIVHICIFDQRIFDQDKSHIMCEVKQDLDFAETVACLRVPGVGPGYILTKRERGNKYCIGQQFWEYIAFLNFLLIVNMLMQCYIETSFNTF